MSRSKLSIFFTYLLLFSNISNIISFKFMQEESKKHTPVLGYPERKSIKGLQPDFQDPLQILGNAVHGVAMNFIWMNWQPTKSTTCTEGQVQYDGYCFNIDQKTADTVKTYSDAGIVITGVFYGVPEFARRPCTGVVDPMFCAPTDPGAKDYGRFVGFIAYYFNGENGHGRVSDFVIHNEVNASEWFNYGCTQGTCFIDPWTSEYALSYNAAYDYIMKEQLDAKVLISFEHNFDASLDSLLSQPRPQCSVQSFLKSLVKKLGSRKWRVAFHSYPKNLLDPTISADDYPQVTFGNIGIIAGWIRQNWPNNPEAWEIQLTENGINGLTTQMYDAQNISLCQAFKNILGTPGIESFIYHRLRDHPTEVAAGLGLGLWTDKGEYKPAWITYALANQKVEGGNKCGFEYLPYVLMSRGKKDDGFHWVTTRMMPAGFTVEKNYKILREKQSGTEMVYECRVGGSSGGHAMISKDVNCEGNFNMGPMGYIYTSQLSDLVPVYRCFNKNNGDHFISSDEKCEGFDMDALIGYAVEA